MIFYRAKFLRYSSTEEGTPWYALAANTPGEDLVWLNVKGNADPAIVDDAVKRAEEAFARGDINLSQSPNWRSYTSAYVNLPNQVVAKGKE
jgi:hypothetical protein